MISYYASPAALIVTSTLLPALGALAISIRFYIRERKKESAWVDDWLTVPALISECIPATLIIWGAVTKSLGEELQFPPNSNGASATEKTMLLIYYLFNIFNVLPLCALKLSVVCLFRRIFCNRGLFKNKYNHVTKTFMVLIILWTITFLLGFVFVCDARSEHAFSSLEQIRNDCPAWEPLLKVFAVSDVVLDVCIWLSPLPTMVRLHMSVRHKIADGSVFFWGLLVVAASATRMGVYFKYVDDAFESSENVEENITNILFWAMIECGTCVVVICIPIIHSFVRKTYLHPLLSSIRAGRESSTRSDQTQHRRIDSLLDDIST